MIDILKELKEKIEKDETVLLDLFEDRLMLSALLDAGVDNWQGYEFAMEMFEAYLAEYKMESSK